MFFLIVIFLLQFSVFNEKEWLCPGLLISPVCTERENIEETAVIKTWNKKSVKEMKSLKILLPSLSLSHSVFPRLLVPPVCGLLSFIKL